MNKTIKHIDSQGIAQRVFGPNWSTMRTVITQVGCLSMRHNSPLLADNTNTIQPLNTGYIQASAPSTYCTVHMCAGERSSV